MENGQKLVRVIQGRTTKGALIQNRVLPLIRDIASNDLGTFITVAGQGHEDLRNGSTRIYLQHGDYEIVANNKPEMGPVSREITTGDARTDTEISQELKETFDILSSMTNAVANGVVKGLVVSGPAGIGKSHTVETTLKETLGVVADLIGSPAQYEVIKGNTSALNLYCMLYRYSSEGSVLILDDIDSALYDEDCLNLLKAVLDTKKTRRVHWGTTTYILEREEVPSSFDFQGGVIFLTNINWQNPRSPRIANHLQAILSRVHYLNLDMDTMRERIIHIKNVVYHSNMLSEYDFTSHEVDELMTWLIGNVEKLQSVDLRTVLKAADLMKAMPDTWKSRAQRTLMKKQ